MTAGLLVALGAVYAVAPDRNGQGWQPRLKSPGNEPERDAKTHGRKHDDDGQDVSGKRQLCGGSFIHGSTSQGRGWLVSQSGLAQQIRPV